MFITTILGWVKSLAAKYQRPQTYGSALEMYILSNHPYDLCDIDRLTQEFNARMHEVL